VDEQAFWNVIGEYNQTTWVLQCVLIAGVIVSIVLAYFGKVVWMPKAALGITNLFIGAVFFLVYGSEPVQTYFAAPLFIAIGSLLLWEALKYPKSSFMRFNKIQRILLCLVALYPLVSFLLGHLFPQTVLYIMPCPAISLSIVVYTCYEHKNKVLLALMAIWGLTGIKSFFVNALEDIILLICGVYCVYALIWQIKYGRSNQAV